MVIRDDQKTEKGRGRRRSMKSHYLCMLRLKGSTCAPRNKNRASPMSLLERFRDAVFRLIMLSALSRQTPPASSDSPHRSYSRPHQTDHRSEAVADCIEFIKKSATAGNNPDSSSAAATELVIPVPVM